MRRASTVASRPDAAKTSRIFCQGGPAQLSHAMFPVGALDKAAVRDCAASSTACRRKALRNEFACPGWGPRGISRAPGRSVPTPIRNADGELVGRHARAHLPSASARDSACPRRCAVCVAATPSRHRHGRSSRGARGRARGSGGNWIAGVSGRLDPRHRQIRYRHREAPATLVRRSDTPSRQLRRPQRGVAPGQAVVFYQGRGRSGGLDRLEPRITREINGQKSTITRHKDKKARLHGSAEKSNGRHDKNGEKASEHGVSG